jgi:hypothetical protein
MHGIIDVDDTIANAEREFPLLRRFFGAYFHEDWHEEHAGTNAAVAAYLRDAPAPVVTASAVELDRVLALGLDDASLGRLLRDGFGCNYVPEVDELTPRAWLERVRGQMQPAPRD